MNQATATDPLRTHADPAREYRPAAGRWTSLADLMSATKQLADELPPDVSAIAGVPRAGMMAAAAIASLRHLHLYALNHDGTLQTLPSTWRHAAGEPDTGGLVIVDDVITTGRAMDLTNYHARQLRARGRHVITAAALADPASADLVDLHGQILPQPHILEWSFANSSLATRAGWDIDGVICQDCPPHLLGEVTDAYEDWMRTAKPLYPPRRATVPLIVTGRLEQHRRITESWLRRHGISWRRLEMAENYATPAQLKADHYGQSTDCDLFIESCPAQAQQIHEMTRRRVLCPTNGKLWH